MVAELAFVKTHTIQALTGEANHINYLVTLTPVTRWDISGSRWAVTSGRWWRDGSRKNGTHKSLSDFDKLWGLWRSQSVSKMAALPTVQWCPVGMVRELWFSKSKCTQPARTKLRAPKLVAEQGSTCSVTHSSLFVVTIDTYGHLTSSYNTIFVQDCKLWREIHVGLQEEQSWG